MVSMSDCQFRNAGSILRPASFFFLSISEPRHLSTPPSTTDGCLLGSRVVSVASLPVMVLRLGWGSWFKSDPRLNAADSLEKPSGSLESGRMGNTSPATELLRRPTQHHTDELCVGSLCPDTPHPVCSGKLCRP